MDIRDHRGLKHAADRSLAMAAYSPLKLIYIHTAVALALSLGVTALDFVLEGQIGNTGGLSGMGIRSVLTTIQTMLRMVEFAILPFWEMGYIFTVMRLARVESARPENLLTGFFRSGPVLRTILLQALIYTLVIFASSYLAMQLFLLSPLSTPVFELLQPYMGSTTVLSGGIALDDATALAVADASMPMLWFMIPLCVIFITPLAYSYRLVNYCLMDDPKRGAFAALRTSRALMRGKRFQMFRLDLSFWWYYLLHALLVAICYGDQLLPVLGIQLPWSKNVGFFLFYVVSLLCQLALYVAARNKVEATYVLAYDALRTPAEKSE